ncbi:hypothetical protein [Mycobacterium malmoense]|uniref:hypothetical protein n=1 Tax=Mycobacterium malmoense TaxID=1780 RepID=UPI0021095F8E|nr:hypothetical protein [Mycobacterium malmoense]
MLIAQAAQLPEVADQQFENPNGATQDGLWVAGHQTAEEHLAPNFDTVDRDVIHPLHRGTIGQTIRQDLLTIDDDVGIDNRLWHYLFGGVEQEFVAGGHRFVDPPELEIVIDEILQWPRKPRR